MYISNTFYFTNKIFFKSSKNKYSSINYIFVLLIALVILISKADCEIKSSSNINDELNFNEEEEQANLNFITELNSATFDKFLNTSDVMFILFVEPNCLKCNRFTKSFLELNEILSKEKNDLKKIRLATVNGFKERKIAQYLNIEDFPNFLFINKRINQEDSFSDIQSTNELYEYLKKKIIRKWNLLENLQQANDFRVNKVNMIVCRNEKSEIQQEFFEKLNLIIQKYENINYYTVDLYKLKFDIQMLDKLYQGNFLP